MRHITKSCDWCIHHAVCKLTSNTKNFCDAFEQTIIDGERLAEIEENALNSFGFDSKAYVERTLHTHPTVIQSFFRCCVMPLIQAMAQVRYYDDRSAVTVEICKRIIDVIGDDYSLPFI